MGDDEEIRQAAKRRRRQRRADRLVVAEYYRGGEYQAQSCSETCWRIAVSLDRTTKVMLWCDIDGIAAGLIFVARWSIVGMTDQFVRERCTAAQYEASIERYRADVQRFQSERSKPFAAGSDERGVRDIISYAQDEYRFLLFRHWSLYDAMLHSRYVAVKFGVWRERGRIKLLNLLAKMGCVARLCLPVSLTCTTQVFPGPGTRTSYPDASKPEKGSSGSAHAAIYKLQPV